MTVITQTREVRALAIPGGVDVAGMPRERLVAGDFVLVSDADQYAAAVAAGAQPILVTLSFSVTDSRGRMRLLLGDLLAPWRWRRVLLNEGITRLTVVPGRGGLRFRVAAALARTRVDTAVPVTPVTPTGRTGA
ncbi:MAG TPA: hypothetical protein VGC45_10345 [Gryllotalpicola sp.]